MALAILKLTDRLPAGFSFRIDTGSSPWWELVIGEAVTTGNALEMIDQISLKLPLKGPEDNNLKTGKEVHLDATLFDEKKRFVQLISYKTKEKKGPSYSEVVEVIPRLKGKYSSGELPEIRLPQNLSVMTAAETNHNNSFSVRESVLSGPMSFAALLPMLKDLLPLAGSLLGGLMNKGGTSSGSGTSTTPAANAPDLKSLLTPENIKAVTDLITQLMEQNKKATAKSLSGSVSSTLLGASVTLAPLLGKILTPEAIVAIGSNPDKLYAALADAIVNLPEKELIAVRQQLLKTRPLESTVKNPPTIYSEAKIAPALLAALPALMPLLEKAMDPQMINAIGDQPNKLLNTVQNGLLNLNKEQYRHIEAILPKGINMDDALKQMIGSINAYNAVTHLPQPAPAQPATQSVIMSALFKVIPVVEKILSENEIAEIKQNAKELAEKVYRELEKLQKEVKENIREITPGKTTQTESLSFSLQDGQRSFKGSNIFNTGTVHSFSKNDLTQSMEVLTAVLPFAIVNEYQQQKRQRISDGAYTRSLTINAQETNTDPAACLLIKKINDAIQAKSLSQNFVPGNEYQVEIAGSQTIDINGIPKVVYVKEKGIAFALKIIAANGRKEPIPAVMVKVEIKDADDKKILSTKKFYQKEVQPGQLTEPLRFEPSELTGLPSDCDLLVHFTFAWKTKKETKAVRKTHAIMITDGYMMGRIGETLQAGLPLNNVHTHRNFWHKVWDSTASVRRRVNIQCRYLLHYNPDSPQNSMMETKTMEQSGERNEYNKSDLFIKMKSGMGLSPVALNQVLPQVSSHPSLSLAQLKALRSWEFQKQLNTSAQSQLKFKNKEGESSSLWVYPEVDLFRLTLKKANAVNALGNVLDTKDEEVVFIRPSSVHFIGTKN